MRLRVIANELFPLRLLFLLRMIPDLSWNEFRVTCLTNANFQCGDQPSDDRPIWREDCSTPPSHDGCGAGAVSKPADDAFKD